MLPNTTDKEKEVLALRASAVDENEKYDMGEEELFYMDEEEIAGLEYEKPQSISGF